MRGQPSDSRAPRVDDPPAAHECADEALHGTIAANMRAQQRVRFRLFTYAALDD